MKILLIDNYDSFTYNLFHYISKFKCIVDVIRNSNIMDVDCEAPIVLDYMAIYKLSIDGNKKEILFPGCEKEMNKIEDIIPEVDHNLKGGA